MRQTTVFDLNRALAAKAGALSNSPILIPYDWSMEGPTITPSVGAIDLVADSNYSHDYFVLASLLLIRRTDMTHLFVPSCGPINNLHFG